MAPSYIASVVAVVAQLLPVVGIHIGQGELQTTVTTIIAIVAGLVVIYRQLTTGRATVIGTKPS